MQKNSWGTTSNSFTLLKVQIDVPSTIYRVEANSIMTQHIYGHWRSLTLHVILMEVLTHFHNLLGTYWDSCLGLCVSYSSDPPL